MTVSGNSGSIKKQNTNFKITGSKMCLNPRTTSISTKFHSSWSSCSNVANYPVRRSVSASPTVGFRKANKQLNTDILSRPLSADSVSRYSCIEFNPALFSKCHQQNCDVIDDNHGLPEENVLENMMNEHIENSGVRICNSSNMQPGLSAKPPLPPCSADTKNHLVQLMESKDTCLNNPDQDTMDEIVALKFQRWFPNSQPTIPESEYEDHPDESTEILSFREHTYQTCEYTYEVSKNTLPKAVSNRFKHNYGNIRVERSDHKKQKNNKLHLFLPSTGNIRNKTADRGGRDIGISECGHKFNNLSDSKSPGFKKDSKTNNAYKSKHDEEVEISRANVLNDESNPMLELKLDNINNIEGDSIMSNSQIKYNAIRDKQKIDTTKRGMVSSKQPILERKSPSYKPFLKKPQFLSKNEPECNKECKFDLLENTRKTNDNENSQLRNRFSTIDCRNFEETTGDTHISCLSPRFENVAKTDMISWMESYELASQQRTPNQQMVDAKRNDNDNDSVYDEIVDILKVLETEENNNKECINVTKEVCFKEDLQIGNASHSAPAKAIWNLLNEAEQNNNSDTTTLCLPIERQSELHHHHSRTAQTNRNNKNAESVTEPVAWNRLSQLLHLSSAELAHKVVALQLLLEEKETMSYDLSSRCKNMEDLLHQQNQDTEISTKKFNKIIVELKEEKKNMKEEFDNAIKEMEKKHATNIRMLEEKHDINLKKMQEKQAAADKMQRDKWMESKTQRIKELAIKGLEPELNRMAATHQEEISDMRRFHQRQLQEIDESWSRKMAVLKERLEADKEKALAIEREMSRQKLEEEINELEKRYQDQRKRLLAEVHIERENIEREGEATLAVREKEAQKKWEKKTFEMQKKVEDIEIKHKEEIDKLRDYMEMEKQNWMKQQLSELGERESKIKEQCKKERDKHIELVIQKLELEAVEREKNSDLKLKRIKEQYEMEVKDLENSVDSLRRKINENRTEMQKSNDTISQLHAQLQQTQTELSIVKEKYDRANQEQFEMKNIAKAEMATKINILQSELSQMELTYHSQIKSSKSEHERELSQVYNRVKEIVMKKDEVINNLKKQKDAALNQCCQLERLLDQRRNSQLTYK